MKIALVTDWFAPRVGGIEVHVRELAIRLRQRGLEAVVVTPWPGPSEVAGVPVDRLPVGVMPGLGVSISPRVVGSLGNAFRVGRYDVIHSHVSIGSMAAVAAGYAAHRAGLPAVGTFHSVLGRWRHAYSLAAPVLGWRRWPFRVTAVSEVVAADLRSLMPDRPVTLLPPAIDPEIWTAVASPVEPGKLRLVTTARLHPRKRLDALLKILADVRARAGVRGLTGVQTRAGVQLEGQEAGPAHEPVDARESGPVDVTLEVLGEGAQRRALEKAVGRLGLGDAVRFQGAGTEKDVRALLARGDLFVNACTQESFGIAGLEALCAGLPVVARAEGGMASFVGHEQNGLLLDSDDAMARALVGLARDSARLARLRAGAERGIPEAYHWERSVFRHVELYRGLVSRSAGASQGIQEFV